VITVDSHTHLFPVEADKVGSADMLLAQMDAAGVNKAVILNIHPRVSNEFIAEQARTHPDRLIGFCSVDPNDGPAAVEMLDRCIGDGGARGVKIHPPMQEFAIDDVDLLGPVVRKAGELGAPVLTHSWAWWGREGRDAPRRVMALAAEFPDTTFIMAHCGGMQFLDLMQGGLTLRGRRPENLYVDLSGIVFDVADSPLWPFLQWTVRTFGADRVMAGSDFPDHSIGDSFDLVRKLDLDAESMDQILGGTAAALLGL